MMPSRLDVGANPNVLEWARRMSGLTVEEAARRLQVKPQRLGEWERGARRPTIGQLRRVADVYKRPLAAFFLDAAPPDDPLPGDFRRLTPNGSPSVSPQLRTAIRLARVRREATLEIFQELQREPPVFGLAAKLGEDPEQLAEALRKALGQQAPRSDARRALNAWRTGAEDAGVLVFQADRIALDEMRGASIAERPLPFVLLNMQDAFAGRVFTLLHELAHVMLGNAALCLLDESASASEGVGVEVFCNQVAAAALVPRDLLLAEADASRLSRRDPDDADLAKLAKRFAVSAEVIARRLMAFGRVSRSFYQRKRAEFQAQYAALQGKGSRGFAHPATLAVARCGRAYARLALEAYDNERITSSELADLLQVQLSHLDRVRVAGG